MMQKPIINININSQTDTKITIYTMEQWQQIVNKTCDKLSSKFWNFYSTTRYMRNELIATDSDIE